MRPTSFIKSLRLGTALGFAMLLCALHLTSLARAADFKFQPHDVVAFVGGANTVAAQESGHLETLLTLAYPEANVHYRSLAWEGDTVFAQSRDLNYPPLAEQAKRIGATVIVMQFGQAESLSGQANLPAFKDAYRKMVQELTQNGARRTLLITPPPFEKGGKNLPDLSSRNADLKIYVAAIREIGATEKIPVIDLFTKHSAQGFMGSRITVDGLQLSPAGHALVAQSIIAELGLDKVVPPARLIGDKGQWDNPKCEKVRQAIAAKNRLWFDYSRPMNWAFLAGDRTEQPSSRDHLNRSHRWFPEEMEKFQPLIAQAETNIANLAQTPATP